MNLWGPSPSVPNVEGVPRTTDIALYFCGRAISCVWPTVVEKYTDAAEAIAMWYLQRVAFMHESTPADYGKVNCSDLSANLKGGGEVNFSMVFNALCCKSAEKSFCDLWCHQQRKSQGKEDIFLATSNFGFTEHTVPVITHSRVPTVKECNAFAYGSNGSTVEFCDDNSDSAFGYFEEILQIFSVFDCCNIRDFFFCHIINLITGNMGRISHVSKPSVCWGNKSVDELVMLVLPALSALFGSLHDMVALCSAGNITRAFAVWIGVSWNCASFSWQTHLARVVARWLVELERLMLSDFLQSTLHVIRQPWDPNFFQGHFSWVAYPTLEKSDELNISNMYTVIRRICEGCSPDNKTLIQLLTNTTCGAQAASQGTLEHIFGEMAVGSGGAFDTQQARQYILLRITSGVLLYAQFYLSVHSLDTAFHCVQTAVLVGHQWRSNELLTMAHYSSFLVHMACQNTSAAAGDIAIVLQLADAASRREGDFDADAIDSTPRFNAGSLGYMGAALLLLICPGTVDTYLRSVIITGNVAGRPISDITIGCARSSIDDKTVCGSNRHADSTAVSGGHSVVFQTVVQTVRHALWLSEVEGFLDSSSTVVTEVIMGVSRKTLTIIAGHYGVCSALKVINTAYLGDLLAEIKEETLKASFLQITGYPPMMLLRETLRQTSHFALAVQVGAAEAPPNTGPFSIFYDFIMAVETHYGSDGLEIVRKNFFSMSVYRFICCMWLRKHGYMKSAYQELTHLADTMLFYGCRTTDGCDMMGCESKTSSLVLGVQTVTDAETMALNDAAVAADKRVADLQYWPPDHLLLWQHVQFERARLARYLGYSSTLPEISRSLRSVSAASHFVMGVLYAELISVMMLFQRGNHCGALEALEKVLETTQSVGLTLLRAQALLMRAFVLLSCSRWEDALETLRSIHMLPSLLEPNFLLARLRAQGELLAATAAPAECPAALARHHTLQLEACGCFVKEPDETDSAGVALAEKLCARAAVSRLAALSLEAQRAWDDELAALAETMRCRQLQEGKWQLFHNMSIKRVCHDILSGELLQKLQ